MIFFFVTVSLFFVTVPSPFRYFSSMFRHCFVTVSLLSVTFRYRSVIVSLFFATIPLFSALVAVHLAAQRCHQFLWLQRYQCASGVGGMGPRGESDAIPSSPVRARNTLAWRAGFMKPSCGL